MTIQTHIVDRVEKALAPDVPWDPFKFFRSDKKEQIDHVMLQISNKITEVVFNRWNDIFGVKIQDKVIDVKFEVEPSQEDQSKRSIYLTVSVRDGQSNFSISERSLGFRWFFCFLLFTHFRGSRSDSSSIFLFDEPASNLHSRAQEQLLKSFSNITTGNNLIIYSTHSHYMIEPRWLEGAFIVYNDAINYDDSPAEEPRRKTVDTNIHVSRYRDFVGQNPDKITYFQPILDTLQYAPSRLELGREAIFVEGKNDFYTLSYFARILEFETKCRFMPGSGAGGLAPLISMYLGWGTSFLALLDDDEAGRGARDKYRADYILDDARVVSLGELVSAMAGRALEGLLSTEGRSIIDTSLGRSATKKDIGRYFQEKAATGEVVQFDKKTLEDFKQVLNACAARFKK